MIEVILVCLCLFFGLVSFIVYHCVIIVHQAERVVLERFGKYNRMLEPGLNFILPFFDNPREFTWKQTYIDARHNIIHKETTSWRVDLRETVYNFPRQSVFTKDTVQLCVNALMYYRIIDVKKAVYEVDDLQSALNNTVQAYLRDVFGNISFNESLTAQNKVNAYMKHMGQKQYSDWGVELIRMEILEIKVSGSTVKAMKKQVIAERERRAQFIRAEGEKTQTQLISEGHRWSTTISGVAEQQAIRLRNEGAAQAEIKRAAAQRTALECLDRSLKQDGDNALSQRDYQITEKYVNLYAKFLVLPERKNLFLPYEATYLSKFISGLSNVFGHKNNLAPGKYNGDFTPLESSKTKGIDRDYDGLGGEVESKDKNA